MKYNLTLAQSGAFAQNPRFAEIEGENILLNNVILPRAIDPENAFNPHNVRLFVIGHEFGAICAVWAGHEQEAFDEACDRNMLDCLMSENQDHEDDSLTPCGNASELFDLTHTWCGVVEFEPARDIALIVDIVRASENQKDTL